MPPLVAGSQATVTATRKLAVVLGVANHRSLAWACAQSLVANGDYDCILTYASDRFAAPVRKMVDRYNKQQQQQHSNNDHQNECSKILGHFVCNVETDLPRLFAEELPSCLEALDPDVSLTSRRPIDAIIHSVAFANFEQDDAIRASDQSSSSADARLRLSNASWQAYSQAQHISAYSLLETARCAVQSGMLAQHASLTTLSYLGANRAVPNYHIMGPAKASLEALVRGLALDYGHYKPLDNHNSEQQQQPEHHKLVDGCVDGDGDDYETYCTLRVNAVSAGPIQTLSARGISDFTKLQQQVARTSPLRRAVTAQEVAETVRFVASPHSSGITGQTIYVDGGYSSIVPVE